MDSHTTFCENRLLSATEDLGTIVQNVANLEGMGGEAQTLIEDVEEKMPKHDRDKNDSISHPCLGRGVG